MANKEQLAIWNKGVEAWNKWREENPTAIIDLSNSHLVQPFTLTLTQDNAFTGRHTLGIKISGVNLSNANLSNVNLSKADLSNANLRCANLASALIDNANLAEANLSEANLSYASLVESTLIKADLTRAHLNGANLMLANFTKANLDGASITNAKLDSAQFIGTLVEGANISGSSVYAVNVWDLKGEFEEQKDLVVTPPDAPIITVDNIKIAQFIYLILSNVEIRDVINSLTSKTVLILGRFSDNKRKVILNSLRNKLREYNLLPIVFDFDRPVDRNITETVKTLAGISFFVIADITSPKSAPLELQAIVPDYQIPVVPIIQEGELPFSMIGDLRTQHSGLLDPLIYDSEEALIKVLKSAIIDPAIEKHNEFRLIKAQKPRIRSAKDFLDKEME
jgi:uncharacterized protein YjbI with pentapeptide repeats